MKRATNAATPSGLPSGPMTSDLAPLVTGLMKLGLDFAAEALPSVLSQVIAENAATTSLLERLLTLEWERREERRIRTSLKLSCLPVGPTISNFDFAFQPSIERSRIEALATCSWIREKGSLLIVGPPGVGKSHLSVSLGVRAVENGFSVAFFRIEELLHEMKKDADVAPRRLKARKYMNAGLLIVDEVGYDPLSQQEANLFFRLVSHRYGKGSMCVTSNKSIGEWPKMLAGDDDLASAILDRLLHRSCVLNITGRSYRLKELEATLAKGTQSRQDGQLSAPQLGG